MPRVRMISATLRVIFIASHHFRAYAAGPRLSAKPDCSTTTRYLHPCAMRSAGDVDWLPSRYFRVSVPRITPYGARPLRAHRYQSSAAYLRQISAVGQLNHAYQRDVAEPGRQKALRHAGGPRARFTGYRLRL
jgi:hypothetical protein